MIGRNIHYRCGELDIVAWWQGRLCFVEVKTRSKASDGHGGLEEAMTEAKAERFAAAAERFMQGVVSNIESECLVALVWPMGNGKFKMKLFEL